jgi:DNA repair exonuclease SbcCD nuclease subunit
MQKFKKCAMMTDIHFGRKNNSELHNRDCLDFIDWFCEQVAMDPDIDSIAFLGDWHEHRSSVNGMTLQHSYQGAKKLDSMELPVFFVTGNHDLFHRNKRDVFTTNHFEPLKNFHIISEKPLVLEKNNAVFFPYLFEAEYHTVLPKYAVKYDVLLGHFEFKGFVLTGESRVAEHGPDHTGFSHPKRIFSGHYHKRQSKDNVVYIGNTFPADFGDANDFKRGMAVYEFDTDILTFTDWAECPKYIQADLSIILDNPKAILKPNARVKSMIDIELTFEETVEIKEKLIKKFNLRELTLEETNDLKTVLAETEFNLDGFELESTSNIVKEMLRQVKSDKISAETLVKLYEAL